MDNYISLISWSPSSIASGALSDASLLIIVVMAFIGASIITRVANVNTSFNFSVNFAVMLGGCLAVHSWTSEMLLPVSNDLVASAVSANFGMTLAGFVLLFGYRHSV
ncbi:MAG: hypothetical protein OER56_04825 [Hyphomicrobiales bacterium]|nr:hypothetical protein [Hyphomicrobiales bacterium]